MNTANLQLQKLRLLSPLHKVGELESLELLIPLITTSEAKLEEFKEKVIQKRSNYTK